jgi:hypothetical protein
MSFYAFKWPVSKRLAVRLSAFLYHFLKEISSTAEYDMPMAWGKILGCHRNAFLLDYVE